MEQKGSVLLNKRFSLKSVIYIYLALIVGYLSWRIAFTLNPIQPVASTLFLLVDVITALSTIIFLITFLPKSRVLPTSKVLPTLSVDVWIPTFNEDIDVLRRTIYQCVNLHYPHNTYVLDDGNRAEVKALALKLGANYIARATNIDAKAGNLNNALINCRGELIAIFDADFAPHSDFLIELLPYFNQSNLALVQTPQHYYNSSNFQTMSGYSDQDAFFNLILPARNSSNSATWIGTNAVIRREALDSIGGFATASVTEDLLTGMNIHANGWESLYVNKPLAFGLAPNNVSQYFIQRLRWAKGAFQILRSNNPLLKSGLTAMQKLSYLSSLLHFVEGGAKFFYYFFPPLFFIFDIVPVRANSTVLMLMVGYLTLSTFLSRMLVGGYLNIIYDEVYAMIRSSIYLLATTAFLNFGEIKFNVTPKDGKTQMSPLSFIAPLLFLVLGGLAIFSAVSAPTFFNQSLFYYICLSFTVWIFVISIIALKICLYSNMFELSATNGSFKFQLEYDCNGKLELEDATLKKWNDAHFVFYSKNKYPLKAKLSLHLEGCNCGDVSILALVMHVKRVDMWTLQKRYRYTVAMEYYNEDDRLKLISHFFNTIQKDKLGKAAFVAKA